MLRHVQRRRPVAALLSIAAAVLLSGAPAMAAAAIPTTATGDLVAGPPSDSWTVDSSTGPMTIDDVYGSGASSAHGFTDAYQRVWSLSGVGLYDQLERYSSVIWSAYALAGERAGDKGDPTQTSFQNLSGFGSSAYEVTYPADSDGFKWDYIVFAKGDYLATISLATKGDFPHDVILGQAGRQLALAPAATSELRSIGAGLIGAFVVVGLTIMAVGAAVAVLIVLLARRRREPAFAGMYSSPSIPPATAHMSDDRRHWWDGLAWQDTAIRIPPWAQLSADGTQWWDGVTWRRMPPRPL
jgi:hypothetical protein